MNTKLIMTLSALFLAIIGIGLTFLPNEIAGLAGMSFTRTFVLILQLLGALYFSFALINWMAKGSAIGGIYNKPIVIGNLTHFVVGGLALIKAILNDHALPYPVWVFAIIYSVFAVLFGIIFTRHPSSKDTA